MKIFYKTSLNILNIDKPENIILKLILFFQIF